MKDLQLNLFDFEEEYSLYSLIGNEYYSIRHQRKTQHNNRRRLDRRADCQI
jgi:hypothetical protein